MDGCPVEHRWALIELARIFGPAIGHSQLTADVVIGLRKWLYRRRAEIETLSEDLGARAVELLNLPLLEVRGERQRS